MVRIPSHAKNFKHSNKRSTLCKESSTTGKTQPSTYSRNISLTTVSIDYYKSYYAANIIVFTVYMHLCTADNECTETEDIVLKDRLSLVEDIVNRTQGHHKSYRLIGV